VIGCAVRDAPFAIIAAIPVVPNCIMSAILRESCVLFADVSGGARLLERLGAEECARAVDRCVKRMERAVTAHGGQVFKIGGGEVAATFPNADAALLSANEMKKRVGDLPPVSGVKLGVRAGFHVGPIVEEGGEVMGEASALAARLVGLAHAEQIVTSAATATRLSGSLRRSIRPVPQLDLADGGGAVFEAWDESRAAQPDASPPPSPARPGPRLVLHYFGRQSTLEGARRVLTLGREPTCDIVVFDKRASRVHARIERRADRFFLVDLSTNGTFVTPEGEPEFMLQREDIALRGAGHIGFGHSLADGTEKVEYDVEG
jgi:class 3 adenylate cyclase